MIPPLRTAVLLGLLVVAGFVIRVDALRNTAPEVPALGDAHAYHVLAANLAEGRGYIRPYEWEADGSRIATAEYPPALPTVLAAGHVVGITSTAGQRLLLAAVGALTVGLIGLVGRRLGGDGAGYLAATIAAIHPGLWNSDVSLMAEPLASFAGAAVVLAALAVADRPSHRRWIALGVLGGLACLVRSEFLVMVPLLAGAVAWHTGEAWAARLRQVGLAVGALVLVLVPWTVRNVLVFDGHPVLLSNNSGSVARGANCDAAYQGPFKGLWVTDVALDGTDGDPARSGCFSGFDLGGGRNEAQAAAALRAEGTAYLRAHLGEVPGVVVARVGRTVGLYRFTQQRNFAYAEGRNPVWDGRGTRAFQALAVIGLVGLALSWRRGTGSWERWLLLVPPASVLVVVALTYGNPRFRAAAEPAIVVLGALGVVEVVSALRPGR